MIMFQLSLVMYIYLQMDKSGDNEIANLYERISKGDKKAIESIKKLGSSPLRGSPTYEKVKPESKNDGDKDKESQDLGKGSKSQNFRKYLSQKIGQANTSISTKKQYVQKQKQGEKSQYAQPKPFSKVRKRNDIRSQQKNGQNIQTQPINSLKDVKLAYRQLPKIPKNNFEHNIKKNIIKDTINVARTDKDRKSTPPSSKNSFRIKTNGGSKKLLDQLRKINEEQKQLQTEIFYFHKQHKDQIQRICELHKIGSDQTYLRLNQNAKDSAQKYFDPTPISKIENQQIMTQQQKIQQLQKQIFYLNSEIQSKKNQILKKQAKIDGLPLNTYINSVPDIFEERESQQENEQVDQLPQNQRINIDPTKTYQSVMNQMRKKKWGLDRRINYETEGRSNESKVELIEKSGAKGLSIGGNTTSLVGNDEGSKIVVNSRLKQFLFD